MMMLPFLDNRRQFSDSLSFFSKYILCSGSLDNNFSSHRGGSDFKAGVTIFSELSLKQLYTLNLVKSAKSKSDYIFMMKLYTPHSIRNRKLHQQQIFFSY